MFLVLYSSLFTSCDGITTSSRNEAKLERIVSNADKNYEKFTEKDWVKNDNIITQISEHMQNNPDDYTSEKKEKINHLIGKYQALKIKNGLNIFQDAIKNLGQQVEGALEEIADTTK